MSLSIGTWSKSTEIRKPECCAGKLPNGVDNRLSFSCDNSLFWLIFWYVDTDEVNRTSVYRISCSATSKLSKQTLGKILYNNWLQFGYHSLRSWELFPVSVLGLDWGIDGPGGLIYSSSDHEELRNVIIWWFSCKYGYGFRKLSDFMQMLDFMAN